MRQSADRLGDRRGGPAGDASRPAGGIVAPLSLSGSRDVAQPLVREVAQLLFDRREPFGDRLRSRSSSVIECLREQVGGMADVEARGRAGASCSPGWPTRRRAGSVAAGAAQRRDLAVADRARQLRLQRRVRAAGAAAQAVVVGLAQVVRARRARSAPHRVRLLDVAQVARILDDDRAPVAARSRARPCARATRRSLAPAPRTRALRACRAGARTPSSPRRTPRC